MYFVLKVKNTNECLKKENPVYSHCLENCCKNYLKNGGGKLACSCGEEVKIYEWCWENIADATNLVLENNNLEVLFHPMYSSGTACVRGAEVFKNNMHYYWEIKVISNLYGTDVMIGVGTANKSLTDYNYNFSSVLGLENQSWGFSYQGSIQHDKLKRKYGQKFGLGCIIGVHLNTCTGQLEYYLNRKPLGIAFDNLKNKELYPMLSSTAAQSSLKLNCAVSQEETLQMLCLKQICHNKTVYNQYRNIPGLTRYYDRKYFWLTPREDELEKKRKQEEDLTIIALQCKSKKPDLRPKSKRKKAKARKINSPPNTPANEASSSQNTPKPKEESVESIIYDWLTDSDSETSQSKNRAKKIHFTTWEIETDSGSDLDEIL